MDFSEFWKLVEHHGRVAAFYKAECEQLWTTFTAAQQEAIVRAIDQKLRTGRFVHYNPVNAMRDNVPRASKTLTLTYDEYYKAFGTTDAVKGWEKVLLPDQQGTIYVKRI